MIKTGIVISIMNKKAGIMTSSGEFVYVKISKVLPKVGELYTGELSRKNLSLYKYAITAASLMFMVLSSVSAYSYYTPVTTIVVSINPSVSLEANRWNKIISSKALNSDGSQILNNIKLKNKSIDHGLELLVQEAKNENFINDKYVNDQKIISVDIKSNKNSSIDISNFKDTVENNSLNIEINTSASNSKKIDITANNKKIDTSSLDFSNKKENSTNEKKAPNNKNSTTQNKKTKDPSLDSNSNINNNTSTKTKEEFKNKTNNSTGKDTKINKEDKSENNKNKNTGITPSDVKKPKAIKKTDTSEQDKKNKQTDKSKKH